jgi:hypothetical protein
MVMQKHQRNRSRAWQRHQDALQVAYARIDAMSALGKLTWVLQFRKTDLQTLSPPECRRFGYELRALARSVGAGWSWRNEPRPLADRALREVQGQIRDGLRALDEMRRRPVPVLRLGSPGLAAIRLHAEQKHPADFWNCREPACMESAKILQAAMNEPTAGPLVNRTGWRLPAHRVRLQRLPPQTNDPAEHTAIVPIYEARDEPSAIVVAIGHFVSREWSRWRRCPCGCREWYVPTGRQIYFEKACENRARARRRRDEERRKREERRG